ncbi:MAG: hypothetical protein AB9907_07760 [Flexilinea sp.]
MTHTDMAQTGQQAEQTAYQESLLRRIQQFIDGLPGKFFSRLELAARSKRSLLCRTGHFLLIFNHT